MSSIDPKALRYSIVIPAYNRPEYLRRNLDYLNNQVDVPEVVVPDDSAPNLRDENSKIVEGEYDFDIVYLDDYSQGTYIYSKLLDAVDKASEEYCLVTADDDFPIREGIHRSIEFLRSNPDYICAHGKYKQFSTLDANISLEFTPSYEYFNSITANAPEDRLVKMCKNYNVTYYATYRTKDLHELLSKTEKYTCDSQFGEKFLSFTSSIRGKIKIVDELYHVRDYHPKPYGTTGIVEYTRNGTLKETYPPFKEGLLKQLYQESKDEPDGEFIDRAFNIYLKNNDPEVRIRDSVPKLYYPSYLRRLVRNRWIRVKDVVRSISNSPTISFIGQSQDTADSNTCFQTNENPHLREIKDQVMRTKDADWMMDLTSEDSITGYEK